jgi:hypothetical protein
MWVFGGSSSTGVVNEIWAFDPRTNQWVQPLPSGVNPAPRFSSSSAAWDDERGELLIFIAGANTSELWGFEPAANVWKQYSSPGDAPSRRIGHQLIWDSGRSQLLLFGGQAIPGVLMNDLWTYYPRRRFWDNSIPDGRAPNPRAGHSGIWDTSNAQVLLFGGYGGGGVDLLDDLWALRSN